MNQTESSDARFFGHGPVIVLRKSAAPMQAFKLTPPETIRAVHRDPGVNPGKKPEVIKTCTTESGHVWRSKGRDIRGKRRAQCEHCKQTVRADRITITPSKMGPKVKG